MTPTLSTSPTGLAPLICIDRIEETSDAATFVFRTPDGAPIPYKAGQFIIFQVDVADETLHRAYSLSSSPSRPDNVAITVKRVPGGKVSNHLLDHLQPGHMLRTLPPAGDFNIIDRPSTRQVVLLSAGCGITPCISIARWLLDTAPDVDIRFVYSARSGAEVIMAAELDRLAATHANFTLARVLEAPARNEDHTGPLTQALFDTLLPDLNGRTIFTCGPDGYMDAMAGFARTRGFAMDYFHRESFVPATIAASASDSAARYTVQAPGFGKHAEIIGGQSLLEALEKAAVPIIGACRAGVCGACKCQVVAGEVESRSQATLSADEIAAGYVLACSSQAKSDLVVTL